MEYNTFKTSLGSYRLSNYQYMIFGDLKSYIFTTKKYI